MVKTELKISSVYKKDVETATAILKKAGCSEIYLFGSLVTGTFKKTSDIDIGIRGFPHESFFKMYAALEQGVKHTVDLVDFDQQQDFFNMLLKIGEVIRVG